MRTRVERFVDSKMIDKDGEGSSTLYRMGKSDIGSVDVVSEALDIAMKKIARRKIPRLISNDQEMTRIFVDKTLFLLTTMSQALGFQRLL